MDCLAACFVSQPLFKRFEMGSIKKDQSLMVGWNSNKSLQRLISMNQDSVRPKYRNLRWRIWCTPAGLEKELSTFQTQRFAKSVGSDLEASPDDTSARCLNSEELRFLVMDSERSRLIKKLSEANNHNRNQWELVRVLQAKEDELIDFKIELAAVEREIQGVVALAEEVAKSGIPGGSRKINRKYIQSYLLSRLEAVQRLKAQIKDVKAVQSKEVTLFWYGMAESVRIMGSFDGWSEGEDLSPEYTDTFTKFSTTLRLRYEVKFLVDGEWRVSPEFPTVGEDWAQTNLLNIE